MTKELIEKCKPYEKVFKWAIDSNFVRMTNTEFSEVAVLYKEAFGKVLTKGQMTCNTCRLNALKELGKEYFKWKEYDDEQEKPKKRVGRPRKINLDEEQTEPDAKRTEGQE